MKIDFYQCDKCKAEFKPEFGATMQFVVGYSYDLGEGCKTADVGDIDLCIKCLTLLAQYSIGEVLEPKRLEILKSYGIRNR